MFDVSVRNRYIARAALRQAATFESRGLLHQAVAHLRTGLRADPGFFDGWMALGEILREQARHDEALSCFGHAQNLEVSRWEPQEAIGRTFAASGQPELALVALEKALGLGMLSADGLTRLGCLYADRKGNWDALKVFALANALEPGKAMVQEFLGRALMALRNFDAAQRCLGELAAREPEFSTYFLIAECKAQLRDWPAAAEHYRRALSKKPDLPAARYNLGLIYFRLGEYQRGLPLAEARLELDGQAFARYRFAQTRLGEARRWRGEDLSGRHVLVISEQGFGDSVMMLRYLPLLKSRFRAARISVWVWPPIARLFGRLEGVDTVGVWRDDELPEGFDCFVAMMSLIALIDAPENRLTAQQPLQLDAQDVQRWQERLACVDALVKVGVVWAGNPSYASDTERSIGLAPFSRLFRVPGVAWINLSKDAAVQPECLGTAVWLNLMPQSQDFYDTACLVAGLDLVIAVDTAVAHLAATLGKPVWMLNRYQSDWRWGLEGETTPWYTTMRIFRQPEFGDWATPLGQVEAALLEWVRAQGQGGAHAELALMPGDAADRQHDPQQAYRGGQDHEQGLMLHQALASYREALRLDARHRGAVMGLGRVLLAQQRHDEALAILWAALQEDPAHADARHLMVSALVALGRVDEAAVQAALALEHETRIPDSLTSAGEALRGAGLDRLQMFRSAMAHATALALQPHSAASQVGLVAVLQGLQCWEASAQWLEQPWADRASPIVHCLKGVQSFSGLRLEMDAAALAHFEAAARGFPSDHVVRISLAMFLLTLDRYEEGFARYEDRLTIRWESGPMLPVQDLIRELGAQHHWQGEAIEGREFLIIDEQGFGDTLMALRLVPVFKARFRPARIRFLSEKPMARLAQASGFFDEVLPRGVDAELPRTPFCSLMSLPHRLGLNLRNLDDRPYLKAKPEDIARWRARLDALPGLKVGVAWCGNVKTSTDSIRSVPLEEWVPLFDVPGIQWVSLQKGVRLSPSDADDLGLVQWMDDCEDFLDSAALFQALDLVITVDTATVHLAGALGCPTWLLNRYDTEWRWGLQGERAPWYASVRQFRQTCRGDWAPVLETMATALREWALTRAAAESTP
jgi:tetratricopeptide (TPR) repeat protein